MTNREVITGKKRKQIFSYLLKKNNAIALKQTEKEYHAFLNAEYKGKKDE